MINSYKDLKPEEKIRCEQYMIRTLDMLRDLYLGASERAIKSLALVNGGGVITMLSYIHAISPPNEYVKFSLYAFIGGFVLFFLIVLLEFKFCSSQFEKFAKQIRQFYKDEIGFSEIDIFNQEKKPFWKNNIPKWLGYLSFGLALVGIVLGLVGFYMTYNGKI